MAKQLYSDNAKTTMSGSLTSGGSSFTVASGAKFPTPTGGNFFYCTLFQKDGSNNEINVEIVKITANAGNTFTIAQRDVTNITGYSGTGYAYPGTAGTVYVELRTIALNLTGALQSDDLVASAVANTPAGNIAATTVQAAINELDTEKAGLASPAFTGTPTINGTAAATTGDISTAITNERSATATLTNKTLDTATSKIGALSGILKGTAGVVSAATVRTDYAEPTTGLATGILKNTTGTGAHSIAVAGTDYQAPLVSGTNIKTINGGTLLASGNIDLGGSVNGILKCNGSNTYSLAVAGTDYATAGHTHAAYAAVGAITSSGLTMATARLLGRTSASSGVVEELSVGAGLTLSGGVLNTAGSGAGVPSGSVTAFAGSAAPSGWLECNGTAVDRTTYADLFTAIGTTYGAGNGTTTFNLPDLRGEFVRGWDNGRGIDSGRARGSAQSSQNLAHSHGGGTGAAGSHSHNVTVGEAGMGGTISTAASTTGSQSTGSVSDHTHTISSDGGSEARPRNIAMMYIIKT